MKLLNEDCIKQMQKMIYEGIQVDSIVTDPPYELGFMGKSWDSTGIAFQKETWELAFQLLKPGGHLLAFAGSRTYHRIAVAVEDAVFWMGKDNFYVYAGGTKTLPCTVKDKVFLDFNNEQKVTIITSNIAIEKFCKHIS